MENPQDIKKNSASIAKLLCFAAGIFDYIRTVELSRWTKKPTDSIPEKYTEYYTILSALSIAEAEQIAIKKAFLSGMSYSALSRLCLDVHSKYRYISEILQSPGFCDTFLMPQIISYCAFNDRLYEMYAFTLLGAQSLNKG